MNGLINVAIPVFGIILTGYLAGRFAVLGPESATALNRFVYYFAIPAALYIFAAERRWTEFSTGPSSARSRAAPC